MKKFTSTFIILMTLLAVCSMFPTQAQKRGGQQGEKKYSMFALAFYNQENLYDTIDDPKIHDEDFLPGGSYGWDGQKYRQKVHNMSTVLADIATDKGLKYGAAVIGLSEVENRNVCMDLIKDEALRDRGYQVLHFLLWLPGRYRSC